jgi:hypothetical protein
MHIDVLVASHDVEGDRHGARDPWAPAQAKRRHLQGVLPTDDLFLMRHSALRRPSAGSLATAKFLSWSPGW